jgi:hypothetical protein
MARDRGRRELGLRDCAGREEGSEECVVVKWSFAVNIPDFRLLLCSLTFDLVFIE